MSSYRVVAADTPELLAQAYEIRRIVYCEENRFESGSDHDEHDDRAVHSIIIHYTAGVLGAVRLVLPTPAGALRMGEVSRFCITKTWRADRALLRRMLVDGLVALSHQHNIEYWFVLMQDSLARTLANMGIVFEVLGPPVELRGARRAQYCKVSDAVAGMILKDSFDFGGRDPARCPPGDK